MKRQCNALLRRFMVIRVYFLDTVKWITVHVAANEKVWTGSHQFPFGHCIIVTLKSKKKLILVLLFYLVFRKYHY